MNAETPNQELLDEVNNSGRWFHAKKVGWLWAKEVTSPQTIQTIEGEIMAQPGSFVCRGPAGELWPQSPESLHSRYKSTDEVDEEGWRKFVVHDSTPGVMAAQIDHPFRVVASWGELSGKQGDYLVKNHSDKDTEQPDDLWLVDQTIFHATYEQVD